MQDRCVSASKALGVSSIELSAPRPHSATVRMPGDKSISHRAFMCASIADGESSIVGANAGADVRATVDALRALGASIRGDISSAMHVRGIRDFRTPGSALDCGNSGSTMRMLAGLIAGRVDATLDGDASLRRRPMERVTYPLRMMGADVKTTNGKPPLKLRASPQPLRGAAITLPVASAQVKSAVLFAALRAQGPTVVTEPAHTRDHTERMLRSMGASLDVNGNSIAVQPSLLKPLADYRVPGDFSAAFFFIAGAVVLPGSNLRLENLGMNPTRIAALDVLRAMGADIEIMDTREDHGEAIGDVVVRGGRDLRNAAIEAEQIPNLIDEIPALCTLAAAAGIDFEVRNASDLRTKESDRLATTVRLLRAFGAIAEELPDGISIGSGRRLRAPERVTTEGDHRIGMSAAILGLATRSRITIDDTDCIATSFPNFSDVWRSAFY